MSAYNYYKRPYYTKLFKEAFDDVRAYVKKQYQERFDQSHSSLLDLTEIKMEKIGRRGDVTDCQSFISAAFEEDNLVVLEGEKETGTVVGQKLAIEWAKKESVFPMFDLVLYAMHGGVETMADETIELVCEWMSKNEFILPRHHSFLVSLSYQMTSSNKQSLKSHEVDPDGKVRLLLIIDGYDHSKPMCKELEFALQSTESYRFDYKILLTTVPGSITGEICPVAFGCILPVSMISVSQNPPEYLKDRVASIFDDFQIIKQMVSSLNPELVVPFLHGWCLDVATCSEICNTNKTNRRLAVMQLKSRIQLYLRDRDETRTDLLDELKYIIEAFEKAETGDAIINRLKAKTDCLTADASVAGSSKIQKFKMVLKKGDREALMTITSDLHDNPLLVKDLLPRLNQVLEPSDISMVEYRGNKDGWKWAANDLLMFYQMRAKDLNPMIEALKAAKVHELAQKLSNTSLALGAASSYKDGEEEFKRVMSDIQSYVRDKYLRVYAKLRPLPQVNRQFDIRKIWVNLQFENRTELKDPEDYRACMLSAFEENRLLLVKGHQGSGKTTAVRRIAFDWASGHLDKFDLVLVARYKDLTDHTKSILEMALDWMKLKKYLRSDHAEFLSSNKNKIHFLLLVGGLDEATVQCQELDQAIASDDVVDLDYNVVITSRPGAVDEKVRCPSPIAFILPWNAKYLHEYIEEHFKQYIKEGALPDFKAQENTASVLQFLASHPHAEQLLHIPLHITFVCLLQEDGALEPGMSSSLLHRKLCYALVRRQVGLFNAPLYPELLDAFQGEFGTATRCQAVRNLALLAYEALVKGVRVKRVFSYNDLKEKGVDIEMCLKVGFLQTDDEGQGAKYEFPHVSLQYYLAADLLCGEFRNVPKLEMDENIKLANQEVIDENPILSELWQSTKFQSLEPMVCYLMEMALEDGSGEKQKIRNSTGAFLYTWNIKHKQSIGADVYAFALLLRLGSDCDGAAKIAINALIPYAIRYHHHSARSLLSIAGNVSVVRVHECGIWFQDINTVVFSLQPAIYTPIAVVHNLSNALTIIELCLLEEGAFEFLAQTCSRMGWKKIATLIVEFGHSTEFHLPLSSLPTDSVIEITDVRLHFKRPVHSINVTPVIQQILSFATINTVVFTNASISDLSTAMSDQRHSDTLKFISLEKISFSNVDDLSEFGNNLSSFQNLEGFKMLACVLSGSQLIDLLKSSPSCNSLRLGALSCLRENHTFTQFCSLLSSWSNMQELILDYNNFSAEQIVQLIQATKSLNLKRLGLIGNPCLDDKHVAAFRSHHPNPDFDILID